MTTIRGYDYYRRKAGLDFDKFIKLHPEKNGEELFKTFMIRYDLYYKRRNEILRKFGRKAADEDDEDKLPIIEAEKMYVVAQHEQLYIDVMRVLFGIAPDDETAIFGDTIATRYTDFVESHLCDDKPGFYMGDDGLYRLAVFYDDDYIPLDVMKEYYLLGDKVYKDFDPEEKPCEGNIDLLIDGKLVKIPEGMDIKTDENGDVIPFHLRVIDKLLELSKTKDEIVDEYFK